MENQFEKGNLSINSENILPIIKKWLYSSADIFVRELVSNAADAITKLNRLDSLGEAHLSENEEFTIKIVLDKDARTIKFIDNGVGMTADEIKKYINQIAFSGATDFVNHYKEKMDAEGEIIGHFGLGFYSAFMVADKVEIDSLSYREGAEPAHWLCEGGIEFEISKGKRNERGTTVTLHISEDGEEFLDDYNLRRIAKKYCGFIPVDIFFENAAAKTHDKEPMNDKNPLWLKKASDVTDEEYKKFYHQVFMDYNEPLFWIHLNMDYPFRLKGILYFPRLKHELDSIEGQVKLFSNQVFVADNIKEVIPEFLLLLKGVMDCPDLPLNVSRSFLQSDGYVEKLSGYIVRKVADKLMSLSQNNREQYNVYWDDINQFIKYGCVRESDFYDKCRDAVLYKSTKGEFFTLKEYIERNEEKVGKKIVYANSAQRQSQYIRMFEENDVDVVLLTTRLDAPFTTHIEGFEEGVSFARIDSELSDIMKSEKDGKDAKETKEEKDRKKGLITIFKEAIGIKGLNVEVQSFKSENIPAMIFLSEESRRVQEMSKIFNMKIGDGKVDEKLILNDTNELVKLLSEGNLDKDDARIVCEHIWDMASLSQGHLSPERMEKFIERNTVILREFVR
ncbi:MAG: molecular chaperone HtpG [Defluviitaleaceae bacterium]|nr:molecular chaperone HtpG [Defluviitaleaceae bacterium]